jgi:hypothetical protein
MIGSWGSDVFENDTCADYLCNLVRRVARDLEQDLNTLDDGVLERTFGASVAVLRAMAQAFPFADVHSIIRSVDIRRLQGAAQEWFGQVIDSEDYGKEAWRESSERVNTEFEALLGAIEKG